MSGKLQITFEKPIKTPEGYRQMVYAPDVSRSDKHANVLIPNIRGINEISTHIENIRGIVFHNDEEDEEGEDNSEEDYSAYVTLENSIAAAEQRRTEFKVMDVVGQRGSTTFFGPNIPNANEVYVQDSNILGVTFLSGDEE